MSKEVDIEIRRAHPGDAPALTEIALAAKRHWNYPESWIQVWRPQLTIAPAYIETHETWLAAFHAAPIAFYSLKPEAGVLWLDHLWMLPDYMGRGLGARLFRHALERARLGGANALRIESDPHAQGFYEKMGARKTDERRGEVDGEPRVLPVMEINL